MKFIHTSDWQLGMTRHFLSDGAQERFGQARFDAIRTLGQVASSENCEFMVVSGDVFESNQVDRKTVLRGLEALREIPVPVYLLPGNHDPLNAASVYRKQDFLEARPTHVHVLEGGDPIDIDGKVEIVGVPWSSKHPTHDQVATALALLKPAPVHYRVCVAHGIVDLLSPNAEDPAAITTRTVEEAISEGKVHYLALGDRHSVTNVGKTGRIWYSGTPEPTDFDEQRSGFALVVELTPDSVDIKEFPIGTWSFLLRPDAHLNTREDLESLDEWYRALPSKERSILQLHLNGSLSLQLHGEFERWASDARELAGALVLRTENLLIHPADTDFTELALPGYAGTTVERLRVLASVSGADSTSARDALALLMRLSRERK